MADATFTFDELVAATGGTASGPARPSAPMAISTDSRKIAAGSCFVALRGERFDAHDFLGEAAKAGAACVILHRSPSADPGLSGIPPGMPVVQVRDTLVALGALARFHRRRFSIPVVGVTGTNGKTTTKEMIAAILATRGPVLKTEGNLNNEVGAPLTLLRLEKAHQFAVIEMGMNHPGEIARIARIAEPRVGIVTMAGEGHLEGLGTLEGVADAKAELYEALPQDGLAVANADDPRMLIRARRSGKRVLTFGLDSSADVAVTAVNAHRPEGLEFTLRIGEGEVEIRLPLVGLHNARNAAGAAAVASALGCGNKEIAAGLAAVKTVGRRLRLETLPSGISLIDDCYNANPRSMAAALDTLHALAEGPPRRRAVAVLGDMLELGPTADALHEGVGREVGKAKVELLAAFGPRSPKLLAAARGAGIADEASCATADIEELKGWVKSRIRAGDLVLVKGSRGMQLERLVEALR